MPYIVAANTWHCVEIFFDGAGRVQQLFVNGTQLINATSYPSRAAWTFSVLQVRLRPAARPRRAQIWYDDVAVAPTRVGGCN